MTNADCHKDVRCGGNDRTWTKQRKADTLGKATNSWQEHLHQPNAKESRRQVESNSGHQQ